MSQKMKIIYLGILLNVKNNVYENDTELLKKDLLILKKILLVQSNNQQMKNIEKNMQKVLTRARWNAIIIM